MKLKSLVFLISIILLSSCTSDRSDRQRLAEKAYEKQKVAIQLMTQLEARLESSVHQHKDSLLQAIEELEESLFTIPGYNLDMPGHEGHDHDHADITLSSQEIYDVQEELVKQLKQIKTILDNS